jgi:hypothetical protein
MADKPTKSVLPMVVIGALLLILMALLGARLQRPIEPGATVVERAVPPAPDAFEAGSAGLSVGAELEYVARVVGDWRAPGGDCARPIRVAESGGALAITRPGQAAVSLEIGLVKPGVVRASSPSGGDYEFNVGLLGAVDTPRAAITVARAGGAPETWERCAAR